MDQLRQVAQQLLDRKMSAADAMRAFQSAYAQAALDRVGGRQMVAARLIGIHRNSFSRWVWALDLKARIQRRQPRT